MEIITAIVIYIIKLIPCIVKNIAYSLSKKKYIYTYFTYPDGSHKLIKAVRKPRPDCFK